MTKKHKKSVSYTGTAKTGPVVIDIPISQILFDQHQPRKRIKNADVLELAQSIKEEGLQQYPTVTLAHIKNKVQYYCIKYGETRVRAHRLLRTETVRCTLLPNETYSGDYDPDRDLKQASENGCRRDLSKTDIVLLVQRQVEAEIARRGGKEFGAVGPALKRVELAFGKKPGWANDFHALSRLDPELLYLIDEEDGKGINIKDAGKLAVANVEEQKKILAKALKLREKGGHSAMVRYISKCAREIRAERGEKIRGARPFDEKRSLERMIRVLYRNCNYLVGEHGPEAFCKHLKDLVGRHSIIEGDELLGVLRPCLDILTLLKSTLEQRRENYHKNL